MYSRVILIITFRTGGHLKECYNKLSISFLMIYTS